VSEVPVPGQAGASSHPRATLGPVTATQPPIVLAVYGTLRRGEWNAPLLDGASFVGTGRVAGLIREMPPTASREYAYPSLVLDGGGSVVVELYELADPAALAAADILEAYDPADEAGSEYVRRAVEIVDGPIDQAWIYVYNGPAGDMGEVIVGGDWTAHVAGTALAK